MIIDNRSNISRTHISYTSLLAFEILQLLSQKVGAPRSSAAEYYVQRANRLLWEHMRKYSLNDVEEGIDRLRNGSLDILIADTPILDYYRATDHGCKLQKIGDTINEDTYAIGMTKGFPLKVCFRYAFVESVVKLSFSG